MIMLGHFSINLSGAEEPMYVESVVNGVQMLVIAVVFVMEGEKTR